MAKTMTFEEFEEYAKKHYAKGGDGYYECWDERTFNEYVSEFGEITKRDALNMFRTAYEIDRDRAGWR